MNSLYINKEKFSNYIWRKTNSNMCKKHIISVLVVFCEELLKSLMEGNEIVIENFCTLKIKKMKPIKYIDVTTWKETESVGNRKLQFTINSVLAKRLTSLIDLEKIIQEERMMKEIDENKKKAKLLCV